MFKQQPRTNTTYTQRPFNPNIQKNIPFVPVKELPAQKVEQFFSIVMEGDINKIVNSLSDLNMTANIVNSEGQSPIHVVLENNSTGLTEDQKLNIINMLITHGASISSFDKNNVTPLHLAAKYQYPKIIKLFLNNNANVNSSDNFSMTPLHYAVQGNLKQCVPNKKVGSLIPKNTTTIKTHMPETIKNLTVAIIDKLVNQFTPYMKHINLVFEETKNMFSDEISDIVNEYVVEITKIVNDTSKTNTDQLLLDKSNNFIRKINDFVSGKIKKTLEHFPIDSNGVDKTVDGKTIKLLPKETPESIIINKKQLIEKDIKTLYNNDLVTASVGFYNDSQKIYKYIHEIIQVYSNYVIKNNPPANVKDALNEILPYDTKIINNEINNDDENLAPKYLPPNKTNGKKINITPKNGKLFTVDYEYNPYYPNDTRYYTNGNPIYYVTKYIFGLIKIHEHCEGIDSNMKTVLRLFNDKKNYPIVQTLIPEILTSIYNIAQYIVLVIKEESNVLNKTGNLKLMFEQIYADNINNVHVLAIDYCINKTNKLINLIKSLAQRIDNMYKKCQGQIQLLNKIVDLVNKTNCANIVDNFNMSNFDGSLMAPNNTFSCKIPKVKNMPETLYKYIEVFDNKLKTDVRKVFYKNYSPFVSKGCNYYNDTIDSNNLGEFTTSDLANKNHKIQYGNLNFPAQNNNFNTTEGILVGSVTNYVADGSFGNNPGEYGATTDKNLTNIMTSVSYCLDDYLYAVKYKIIDKLLDDFVKDKNQYDKLKEDYETFISKDYADNILLNTIVKIADELVISHIKKAVYVNTNNYARELLNLKNAPITNTIKFAADTGFSLNLNKTFDDLMGIYIKDQNQLMHTINTMEEPTNNEQFKIYNMNYNSIAELVENQCFDINDKVVDLLLKYRIDTNKKDYNGSSPIFYAIKNLHTETVKKLVKHSITNVSVNSVKNNSGFTPYTYAISLYNNHIGSLVETNDSVINMIDRFTKPIYTQLKKNIESNPDYKNNVIRYLDIIFPQLLMMFNNLLYFYAKSYTKGWKYDDNAKLEQLLKANNLLIEQDIPNIPILDDLYAIDTKASIKTDSLAKFINKTNEESNKETVQLNYYNNTLTSLNKELEQSQGIQQAQNNRTDIDDNAKQQINNYWANRINLINNQILAVKNQISTLEIKRQTNDINNFANINKLDSNTIKTDDNLINEAKKYTTNPQTNIDSSGLLFNYVSDEFNGIFKQVINTDRKDGYDDFLLYNDIWRQTLKDNTKLKNIHNIHLLTALLQKQTLQKLNNNNQLAAIKTDFENLKNLYSNVFGSLVNDYFELPQQYMVTENYILTELMNIMTHIVQTTLCSNLYYSIIKTITEYVKTIQLKDDNVHDIVSKILQIDNVGGKPELHTYIIEQMPLLLVKLKTNIYANEFDKDKNNKTIDQLFTKIIDILNKNGHMDLKNSSLVLNLETYIFKYYKDIFNLIIPQMKVVIDNYCRFITNETRLINIMIELIDKTIKEN